METLTSRGSTLAANWNCQGSPFTCFPVSPEARLESSSFRVLVLRRLWLSLPPPVTAGVAFHLTVATTEQFAQVGVLHRPGFALESAAVRVCRAAGARVSINVMFRDLDLLPQDRPDTRRLEVVADGLQLHHGAQLAIDTMVSPLRRDGVPRPWSMTVDGASLETAEGETLPRVVGPVWESTSGGPGV